MKRAKNFIFLSVGGVLGALLISIATPTWAVDPNPLDLPGKRSLPPDVTAH